MVTRTGFSSPAIEQSTGLFSQTLRSRWSQSLEVVSNPYLMIKQKLHPLKRMEFLFGDPDGIRTRVTAVKGRCLRPLDHRAVWWL